MKNINFTQKGDFGEKIAISYLEKQDFLILDTKYFIWNYQKTKKVAEIDIVCFKKKSFIKKIIANLKKEKSPIIFVEVKTLFVDDLDFLVFPENKVNFVKKRKMIKALLKWLKKNKKTFDYPWRMDLITIKVFKSDYSQYKLKHFRNILY